MVVPIASLVGTSGHSAKIACFHRPLSAGIPHSGGQHSFEFPQHTFTGT